MFLVICRTLIEEALGMEQSENCISKYGIEDLTNKVKPHIYELTGSYDDVVDIADQFLSNLGLVPFVVLEDLTDCETLIEKFKASVSGTNQYDVMWVKPRSEIGNNRKINIIHHFLETKIYLRDMSSYNIVSIVNTDKGYVKPLDYRLLYDVANNLREQDVDLKRNPRNCAKKVVLLLKYAVNSVIDTILQRRFNEVYNKIENDIALCADINTVRTIITNKEDLINLYFDMAVEDAITCNIVAEFKDFEFGKRYRNLSNSDTLTLKSKYDILEYIRYNYEDERLYFEKVEV